MAHLKVWMKCIGLAVKANGLRALASLVPFGEPIYDISSDAWQRIRESYGDADQRPALQEIAQATRAEVRAVAGAVAEEVAADQPPEVRKALKLYLIQVPDAVRQSLRRPAEPRGLTVPPGLRLQKADDLLPLLPTRLPRFSGGDRPPGIGDWELEELLGMGGFGEVWRARNLYLAEPVALKFCLDAVAAEALRHEAALLGRVMSQGTHPGIVRLLDTYLGSDPPCLKYEYVEGGDLAGLMRDWPPLPKGPSAEVRTRVLRQLAEIAGHAHRLNPPIVHRDLKPANVLVQRQPDGKFSLRVADFGIGGIAARHSLNQARTATATRGGLLATSLRGSHTPLYASPQQAAGEAPDVRDDVHALGVIWFQMLAGNLGSGVPLDWRDELTEARVDKRFLDLLAQCIASRPERRLADAAVLVERLEAVLAPVAIPVRPAVKATPVPTPPAIPVPPPLAARYSGRAVVVARSGPADFPTIADALREARPGTRVVVRPGTYPEALVLKKAVEIVAEGPAGSVVVECSSADCVLMQTDEAIVRGLTLRGRSANRGGKFFAVDVPQGRLLLEDCDISNDSLACVAIHGGTASPTLRNCRIHGSREGGGVFVFDNARGLLERCDIFGNQLAGVELREGATPILRSCTLHDNQQGGGVLIGAGARGLIEDCDIYDSHLAGVEIKKEGDPIVRNCRIRNGQQSGAYIHEGGKGTFEGCDIFGNRNMGVRIAKGGNPILRDCKIHDSKQSGAYFHEGGLGLLEECVIYGNEKANVKIEENSDPTIRRCKIHSGKSNGVLVTTKGLGSLDTCDIYGNALPGLAVNEGGAPTVRDCVIHDNEQGGVHIYEGGEGTFERCRISGNKFAGVTIIGESRPTVRHCRINGNGYEGVWVYENGRGVIEGCDLTDNARGAWDVAPGCSVERHRNRE